MKVHRFLNTENEMRLYPTRLPGICRTIPYHDLAGIEPLFNPCSFRLLRHAATAVQLRFANDTQANKFFEEVTAVIAPPILVDPTPFPPATIAEIADELLRSPGQNIRKCLDFILRQGINHTASDIMLEYVGEQFEISFKLDGLIIPVFSANDDIGRRVVNCLKTATGLLIYRNDTIQEGRLAICSLEASQDLRVSIIPVAGRERAVIRLFDRLKSKATLDDLGITPHACQAFRQTIALPSGLVIICGPSGSGKTTTAYAALRELKQGRGRLGGIITVEDPIEYKLDEIAQIEVNPVGKVSFAAAVRSILRQDPSVIMIGEIRDTETADAAITAALTGHLVIATLHASGAAEVITRLLDLGIRPVMLNSVLKGILGQRLIRRLCSDCSIPSKSCATAAGGGCEHCHGSGYQGRSCIAEFLSPSGELQALIADGCANSVTIESCALAGGMLSVRNAGLEAVRLGVSDLQEIARVTGC